jgi:hypothetical protein
MLYNAIIRVQRLPSKSRYEAYYGATLKEGDLVKTQKQHEVFLLKDGKKCGFNSIDAFVKRGYDFSQVKVISEVDLNSIPTGDHLN